MKITFLLFCGWMASFFFPGSAAPLSGQDFQRQPLFENGNNGYACYRIPAIVRAPNGDLLAFAEGRTDGCSDYGNIDIVMRRSADNGRSWAPLRIVVDRGDLQAGNPSPVVDFLDPAFPGGRLFLFYNTGNNHESEVRKGKGLREVWYITSTDDGRSWSAPVNITASVHRPRQPDLSAAYNFPEDWRSYANGPGHALQLRRGAYAGRLLIPANHSAGEPQEHFNEYRAHAFFSDDHGQTWRLSQSVDFPSSNESIAAELPDGRVILNSRQQNGERRRRIVSISSDGGASWDTSFFHPQLPTPVCQASLLEYQLPGGEPILLFSNPASTDKRERMTVRISFDGGRTWPAGRLIDAGPSAYSDLVQQGDDRIGLLYEQGNAGGIHYAHFSLPWLQSVHRLEGSSADAALFELASPVLTYRSAFFSDSVIITARLDFPGARLHFTTDGSEPTASSPRYEQPVVLRESGVVQFRAFHDQCRPSAIARAGFFRTAPPLPVKQAAWQEAPAPQYSGRGVAGLFDRSKGTSQFDSPDWTGFEGKDLVLTFEWEEPQTCHSVTVSSLNNPGAWILPPAAIAVYGSNDGQRFTLLAAEELTPENDLPGFVFPTISFPSHTSRFLRVEVKNSGPLPVGHPGAGKPAWLFVDEILVY